jgi:dTDP-4-dehydrorhamnose reductase
MKILLTGAGGQLAGAILDAFKNDEFKNDEFKKDEFKNVELLGLTHSQLDITDHRAVDARVRQFRPDVIINCAAYNHVDLAEEDATAALMVNAFAVRILGRAAADVGAALVHYSTDFVFDGETERPYSEEDPPNPRSVYAASKLLGEWFARDAPEAYVLRVESLFGGRAAHGTVDRILEDIKAGRDVNVFVDRTVSPSYVVDVARATRMLLERRTPGLYHCVGSGCCTWYELAEEMLRTVGGSARIVPVHVRDVELPAARPRFAALSNEKLARTAFTMPHWRDALGRYVHSLDRA